MSTKREIELWEEHLAEQNKELKKDLLRARKENAKREKGYIEVRGEDACIVCKKPGREILFLSKYGQGTALRICKDCLKEALDLVEKEEL